MADFIFPLRKKPAQDYTSGGRAFGSMRAGNRKHAGCDLIAFPGTEILAMADGVVSRGPYYFYEGTYALEIKHDNGMVVRYGEISQRVPAGISAGTSVSRGQIIARVGQLNSGSSMLHLEMYEGYENGPLTQTGNSYVRRSDLTDPTPYLDDAPLSDAAPSPDDSKEETDPSGAPYRKGRVSALVTSTLKVRGKASTDSVILSKLAPGAICKIVEEVVGSPYPPNNSTKWYQVKLAGQEGFVAADFIDAITPVSKPPQASSSVSGRVNQRVTSKLRVRKEPSVSADPPIIELTPGTVFKVLEELHGGEYDFGRTDWCKIEYEGKQGYVAAYYLEIQSEPKPLNRWDRALPLVPTNGASAATARQDHLPEGVQSSRNMAQADLGRIKALADRFCTAASKFGVPAAVLAAIASRESRCGAVLDDGWGDHGNGFGIMQVDKRYHDLEDTSDPASPNHIEQATGIFVQCLKDVQKKHPDWEDPYILKGAAAAYNAGVKTVQTKEGMDIGTTGNDYGSDVMARSQFYASHSDLSVFRT
jgi:hypothetical protein